MLHLRNYLLDSKFARLNFVTPTPKFCYTLNIVVAIYSTTSQPSKPSSYPRHCFKFVFKHWAYTTMVGQPSGLLLKKKTDEYQRIN